MSFVLCGVWVPRSAHRGIVTRRITAFGTDVRAANASHARWPGTTFPRFDPTPKTQRSARDKASTHNDCGLSSDGPGWCFCYIRYIEVEGARCLARLACHWRSLASLKGPR